MPSLPAALCTLLLLLALAALSVEGITCDGTCSGHGACDKTTGYCQCFSGYIGTSCKQMSCPKGVAWADYASATDVAHDMVECSNMGLCDRNLGACKCQLGFEGVACERMSCPTCTNGRCVSMREAAALQDNTNFFVDTTYAVWDADKIFGCQCDNGFSGYDCSQRDCPKGDDPMTTVTPGTPFAQTPEVQTIYCLCDTCTGAFALTFRRRTTVNLLPGDSGVVLKAALEKLDTINGVTVSAGAKLCDATGITTSITFTNNPGDMPLLQIQNRLSTLTATPITLSVTTATQGTREEVYCSNRGTCDLSAGVCTCSTGFSSSNGAGAVGTLGDCGVGATVVCPTTANGICNAQGTCSGTPTFTCACNTAYTGFDCTLRTCSKGKAWFDGATAPDTAHAMATCSNKGSCDTKTGLCTCNAMFTGSACDVLKCPGATIPCNGHGVCKTMQQLAMAAASNGDLTSVTYGNTLNAAATWDFNKIQGCDCTRDYYLGPYSGALGAFRDYDCSSRYCPVGADPYQEGRVNEKQTLACLAENGRFTLTFRQYTTGRIAWDASAADVKTALENLPTVDTVTITFGSGLKVCDGTTAVGTSVGCLSVSSMRTLFFVLLTLWTVNCLQSQRWSSRLSRATCRRSRQTRVRSSTRLRRPRSGSHSSRKAPRPTSSVRTGASAVRTGTCCVKKSWWTKVSSSCGRYIVLLKWTLTAYLFVVLLIANRPRHRRVQLLQLLPELRRGRQRRRARRLRLHLSVPHHRPVIKHPSLSHSVSTSYPPHIYCYTTSLVPSRSSPLTTLDCHTPQYAFLKASTW